MSLKFKRKDGQMMEKQGSHIWSTAEEEQARGDGACDGHHTWGQKRHLQKRIRSSGQRGEEENQKNVEKGRWKCVEEAGMSAAPKVASGQEKEGQDEI